MLSDEDNTAILLGAQIARGDRLEEKIDELETRLGTAEDRILALASGRDPWE